MKQKLITDNCCTSINVKLAFFTAFVLTLQTLGFVARWCFWFSANESSIEQVYPPLVYAMCKKREWKRSSAANKTHSLQPMPHLRVLKCAVPPDHLRSEISSHVLAIFQIIGKAW